MAGREAVKRTIQQVRPILSIDKEEARKRVLNLYKAWYRQIPYIGKFFKTYLRNSIIMSQIRTRKTYFRNNIFLYFQILTRNYY